MGFQSLRKVEWSEKQWSRYVIYLVVGLEVLSLSLSLCCLVASAIIQYRKTWPLCKWLWYCNLAAKEISDLWMEYEENISLEAKVVKDFDKVLSSEIELNRKKNYKIWIMIFLACLLDHAIFLSIHAIV